MAETTMIATLTGDERLLAIADHHLRYCPTAKEDCKECASGLATIRRYLEILSASGRLRPRPEEGQ